MESDRIPPERRRFFLTVMLAGVGAALTAAAGWPVVKFLAPRQDAGKAAKAQVPRSEVPVGGAHFFDFHGRPAVVLQPAPGQFLALTAVCTHLGSIVKWVGEK